MSNNNDDIKELLKSRREICKVSRDVLNRKVADFDDSKLLHQRLYDKIALDSFIIDCIKKRNKDYSNAKEINEFQRYLMSIGLDLYLSYLASCRAYNVPLTDLIEEYDYDENELNEFCDILLSIYTGKSRDEV